ncbi:hypothetical protein GQ53DRAFT_436036 [Thozetella sp. PMI_491]|nr:hypothetical protein GQ53DRAFT_436036 [Thozetella sp. PMI_491]
MPRGDARGALTWATAAALKMYGDAALAPCQEIGSPALCNHSQFSGISGGAGAGRGEYGVNYRLEGGPSPPPRSTGAENSIVGVSSRCPLAWLACRGIRRVCPPHILDQSIVVRHGRFRRPSRPAQLRPRVFNHETARHFGARLARSKPAQGSDPLCLCGSISCRFSPPGAGPSHPSSFLIPGFSSVRHRSSSRQLNYPR